MTIVIEVIDRALPMLWRATWQASALVVLVLVVRAILGARLSPGWRHALWCVVLARFLAPVLPSSPASLYRLDPTPTADFHGSSDEPILVASRGFDSLPPVEEVAPIPDDPVPTAERPALDVAPSNATEADRAEWLSGGPPINWSASRVAGMAWLVGVLVFSARTAAGSVRLARASRTWVDVEDPEMIALLDACRQRMGVRRTIRLRITTDGLGPAAMGFLRPSILIPRSVLATISRNDLEHILMHECSHIRRGDVAVQWLMTSARIVHWFNPVSWFVASRIRADRELACDSAVLGRLDGDRRSSYGGTILALASRFSSPRPLPGLVGAFGSHSLLHERIAMIASHSPGKRGRNRLAALVLILLAVIGLTDAAPPSTRPVEPVVSTPPREIATAPDDDPPIDDATRNRIEELITTLRGTTIDLELSWAFAIRDLAEIGEPAVPALIEELDRTTEDRPLRALGFTLRAIGDPRAVPALIRAIPRTLVESGSDFGLRMVDPELLAFLQENDLDENNRDAHTFDFGRAFREVTGALKAITGHRFNEDELNFVDLAGGPAQRQLQRRELHTLAERWAFWWEDQWRQFTDDPAYAEVDLPPLPPAPRVAGPGDPPFPTGPKVRVTKGWSNVIAGPPQPLDYYRTFIDLDTRRSIPWPESLGAPEEAAPEDVDSWAVGTGYDLQGIKYQPPGSEATAFGLRGVGLRAWQIQ